MPSDVNMADYCAGISLLSADKNQIKLTSALRLDIMNSSLMLLKGSSSKNRVNMLAAGLPGSVIDGCQSARPLV